MLAEERVEDIEPAIEILNSVVNIHQFQHDQSGGFDSFLHVRYRGREEADERVL